MAQGEVIYKICRKQEYETAKAAEVFSGSADDQRDGFLHFSTRSQLKGTLEKHFSGEGDLVLLELSAESLGPNLKWEVSRGGEKFPHLYGDLEMSKVDKEVKIFWDGTRHQYPEEF